MDSLKDDGLMSLDSESSCGCPSSYQRYLIAIVGCFPKVRQQGGYAAGIKSQACTADVNNITAVTRVPLIKNKPCFVFFFMWMPLILANA